MTTVGMNVERLVVGTCLVGLGVLWTLSNSGLVDLLATLRTWWPVALIYWGALELINVASIRRRA